MKMVLMLQAEESVSSLSVLSVVGILCAAVYNVTSCDLDYLILSLFLD
jgi:hypothetical protein